MRLIIAGGLKGQIIAAAKIAMSHGAAVTHTESLDQTLAVLRTKGADLLMVDVVQPIAAYVAALEAELAAARNGRAPDADLQSELDLMRTTRAAEIAALDDIMTGLEQLIARAPRASDAPYAENVAPMPGEVVAFDKSEG